MQTVKVAIIGAGTAGLSARREVAKVTDDYVVIEGGDLGTTCARAGCMPSKVFIQVANDFVRRKVFSTEGIEGADHLTVNTEAVMEYVRQLRDRFVTAVLKDMTSWQDHLIKGYANFIDANTLQVNDEKIFAEKIIIATGSTPFIPDNFLSWKDQLLDTDSFFELKDLPKKIVVVGLGVIGIELGQALCKLDLDVSLVGLGKSLGGLTDPVLQDYVAKKFESQCELSFNGAQIVGKNEAGQLLVCIDQKTQAFDSALIAVGRHPNLKLLALDKLNISYDKKGLPLFNDTTFQLKDYPNIYFVGDVNVSRPLLHEAADQGRIAGFNAVQEPPHCFQKRTSLAIVFTDPNIATIGQRYQQLTESKIEFVTGSVSFEGQGRSIVQSKEQGMLHVYARTKDGLLLGAELQAPDGEHLAHLLAWAIANQMTVDDILAMPFYHPTVEEGVRTALRDASRQLAIKAHDVELFRCSDTPIR